MDCGELVIVPVLREGKLREGTEPIWKMVLTDKSLLKKTVYATCRWKVGSPLSDFGNRKLIYIGIRWQGTYISWFGSPCSTVHVFPFYINLPDVSEKGKGYVLG